LQASGLHIASVHGDFSIKPTLALSADEIDSPDVVLVALKNYHLEAAMPEIRKLVAGGAKVLPLLNGVQHVDVLRAEFGSDHVLGGVCYIEATLTADGNIVQSSPMQDIVFGAFGDADSSWLERFESVLRSSQVNVRLSPDIIVEMWQKFIFLTSLSGITAAARKPIGAIVRDEVAYHFMADMVAELVAVAHAQHIGIPDNAADQVIQRMNSLSPNMTSSLHRDLEKGLPLEIDSLQGTIVHMANHHGISVPCTRAVYALLHPYQNGNAE
jgi:2-dehydropantoate 2-reductase